MRHSSRNLKERVWARDGVACRYCGAQLRMPDRGVSTNHPLTATVDHVVPRSKGGRSTMRNLVTACLDCNKRKSDMHALDFRTSAQKEPS